MSILGRLCSNFARNNFQVKSCELWQSRCFRTKRSGKTGKDNSTPPVPEDAYGSLPPVGFSALGRPVVFGLVFSGSALAGCAVWQYENMREAARRSRIPDWSREVFGRKAGDIREEFRQWWKGLQPADKMFVPICAINCLVFAAWRYPPLQSAYAVLCLLTSFTFPLRCQYVCSAFLHATSSQTTRTGAISWSISILGGSDVPGELCI